MHYVTHIPPRTEKHKFDITFPGKVFVESDLVPPEQEE
jgi:hypothetical protein